jgi:predicted nucleic acid-binding protein
MIIVVNDANVLIDLVKLQLLPYFFSLQLEFYTTDLILDELHDWQVQELKVYINNGTLTVIQLTDTELIDIALLQAEKRQLSEQDCSAIVCARKVSGDLLTSDNNLRKFAAKKLLTVYGHLWVFDRMVETSVITPQVAIEKLTELRDAINPRLNLPKIECENRFELWRLL